MTTEHGRSNFIPGYSDINNEDSNETLETELKGVAGSVKEYFEQDPESLGKTELIFVLDGLSSYLKENKFWIKEELDIGDADLEALISSIENNTGYASAKEEGYVRRKYIRIRQKLVDSGLYGYITKDLSQTERREEFGVDYSELVPDPINLEAYRHKEDGGLQDTIRTATQRVMFELQEELYKSGSDFESKLGVSNDREVLEELSDVVYGLVSKSNILERVSQPVESSQNSETFDLISLKSYMSEQLWKDFLELIHESGNTRLYKILLGLPVDLEGGDRLIIDSKYKKQQEQAQDQRKREAAELAPNLFRIALNNSISQIANSENPEVRQKQKKIVEEFYGGLPNELEYQLLPDEIVEYDDLLETASTEMKKESLEDSLHTYFRKTKFKELGGILHEYSWNTVSLEDIDDEKWNEFIGSFQVILDLSNPDYDDSGSMEKISKSEKEIEQYNQVLDRALKIIHLLFEVQLGDISILQTDPDEIQTETSIKDVFIRITKSSAIFDPSSFSKEVDKIKKGEFKKKQEQERERIRKALSKIHDLLDVLNTKLTEEGSFLQEMGDRRRGVQMYNKRYLEKLLDSSIDDRELKDQSGWEIVGLNFDGQTLEGYNFDEAKFMSNPYNESREGVQFSDVEIRDCSFDGVYFEQQTRFSKGSIEDSSFVGAKFDELTRFLNLDIENVDFSGSEMIKTNFYNNNISNGSSFNNIETFCDSPDVYPYDNSIKFRDCIVENSVSFDNANLNFARVRDCDFQGVNFEETWMRSTHFNNNTFSEVSFNSVDLSESKLRGRWISCDFSGSKLEGCSFGDRSRSGRYPLGWSNTDKADIYDCNFSSSNLANTSFIGKELSGVDFTNADMKRVTIRHCYLHDLDFTGANIDRVKFGEVKGKGEGKEGNSFVANFENVRGVNTETFDFEGSLSEAGNLPEIVKLGLNEQGEFSLNRLKGYFLNQEGSDMQEEAKLNHFYEGRAMVFFDPGDNYDPNEAYISFIDKKGGFITNERYQRAEDFEDGVAKVTKDGEEFYIDKSGNRVEKTKE